MKYFPCYVKAAAAVAWSIEADVFEDKKFGFHFWDNRETYTKKI